MHIPIVLGFCQRMVLERTTGYSSRSVRQRCDLDISLPGRETDRKPRLGPFPVHTRSDTRRAAAKACSSLVHHPSKGCLDSR